MYIRNMKRTLTTFSTFALFAGAVMAAEPTKTVESIENEENVNIASGEYLQASGAYYRDGGKPDGQLHKGPVVNVGNMSVGGIFEVKATDQNANRLFDVKNVSGAGEIRFGRGVYISQESDFSNFNGTLTLFTEINEQGNRKGAGAYFLSGTNNPSNIKEFNLAEKDTELSFTNGNYTLNGKINGVGKISARTSGDLNFDGDKILENATSANVSIKGDISNFTGSYAAGENSTIKLETKLADSVLFQGTTGGYLELIGAEGDARKTITVESKTTWNQVKEDGTSGLVWKESTTTGSVYMYGNNAIIAANSNDAGDFGENTGTIYFGGKNAYTQSEKLVYSFDKSTVTGKSAGNVTIGGKGAGSVMENGADITVDGVRISRLTAGAEEGAVVNGDVNVLVKSGEIKWLFGGRGGTHTGNTNISVEDGKIGTIAIGDNFGGKIKGDMTLNVSGGEIEQIYGVNYRSESETASDFNGVNGNVQINVNGGTVKNIRGGINTNNPGDESTAKSKMVLNGNVEINVGGNAKITQGDGESILAVGGSYGSVNGNTTVNISDNATVEGIIAMGGSRNDAAVKSTFLNIGGGTLNGDVYAGALKAATVLGDTNTTISGGTLNGDIYGGGSRADTIVKGNSNITLSGSVAKINGTIYGGGKDGGIVEGSKNLFVGTAESAYVGTGALKVSDFDKINVAKGTNAVIESLSFTQSGAVACGVKIADGGSLVVNGDVIRNYNNVTNVAGSDSLVAGLDGGDAVVKGTVRTVIDGADTNIKKFYGGNGGNQKTGEYVYNGEVKTGPVPKGTSTVGAVDITVNNGTISDFILASGAMHSDVAGNVDIKINGGNISEITGGACGANVGGDVNIVVNGGKIGKIEAGGCGSGENIREDGIVGGSTNVVLGGNSVITGDVYGGGWSDGEKWRDTVKGSTNITLKDSVSVGGNLYGGSMGGTGTIVGSKNLFVGTTESAYLGSSALKVADFQKIDIVNGSANFASFTQAAEGTLVSISDKGKLSMSLNSASQLSDTSFENAGELVFKRGLLSDSDSVALKSYTGSGNVSAYGGTFADGVFTAGKSAAFDSSAITVGTGAADVQSVRLADKLALDFNVAGLGEAAITVNEVRESTDTTGIDGKVLAAFDVNVSDNDNNYTVVFSAYVGALEDAGVLTAWHKGSDGVWTKLDTAIDYANEIASITVDGFSSYAFAAAVPEPATMAAILGAVALSFAVFRRRK